MGTDTAVFTQETTASNIQVAPALLRGSYSWHVQALDNDGSVTAELTSTFSVKGAITLRYPLTEEAVGPSPIVQWESFPDTVSYHVVVLDDVAYPPQVVIDQIVIEPMLAVETPLAPGHYSWAVWAQDGETAVLAELTSTFSVKDVVELVAPAAGETVSTEPLLQWQGYPGAVSYQVIVIDDDAYPPVVVLDQKTTETSLAVTPPLESGSYSWTVWAFDGSDKLLAELNSSFVVADSE